MLLGGLIILLVVDFSTRPCSQIESTAEHCKRLFCDIFLKNTPSNYTDLDGQTCETLNDTFIAEEGGNKRSNRSPCTYVKINEVIE